jgi:hypothetical protein
VVSTKCGSASFLGLWCTHRLVKIGVGSDSCGDVHMVRQVVQPLFATITTIANDMKSLIFPAAKYHPHHVSGQGTFAWKRILVLCRGAIEAKQKRNGKGGGNRKGIEQPEKEGPRDDRHQVVESYEKKGPVFPKRGSGKDLRTTELQKMVLAANWDPLTRVVT